MPVQLHFLKSDQMLIFSFSAMSGNFSRIFQNTLATGNDLMS